MHARTRWTEAEDGKLCALRAAGLTWDEVAKEMGLGRYTVVERGRRMGARGRVRRLHLERLVVEDRPALPAGHPDSWGLITANTVLEGEPYPYPVFL